MSKLSDSVYRILAKWYRSSNGFFRFLAYICYDIIGLPLYWISQGKEQFASLSDLTTEMRRQNRKVTGWTKIDILFEFIFHGYLAYEYVAYHFEEKSFKERKAFYSEMDRWRFTNIVNNRSDIWKLRNKRLAYEIFKKWYNREQIIVASIEDFDKYSDFISRHTKFFMKPFAGGGGINSGWFDVSKYSSPSESLEAIIKNGSYVLEEGVYQCQAMADFNPDSINTLRIVTIKQSDKISNWFAFVRTGRKGCPVDNGGRGGIIIGVDINKGELSTDGINEQGEIFKCHPDSGKPYKGFKLPFWEESLKVSMEMMNALPSINCIGWDIALTDKGPVIIEANGQTALCGPQITQQKGLRKEYEEVLMTLR